ncbi:MAG: hypothetical protein IJA67_10055 [Oscillospiraceae bacterium]|nr:hypothetical protein [Oscillospiraceae bacterium]
MKKIIAILLAGLMLISLAACNLGGGGGDTPNNNDKGGSNKAFDTQVPGLPDYPYGEMVREQKHDDGSGHCYFYNTTLEEFQTYCKSLKDEGIVPLNANFDFYEDGEVYYCKNEDAGYDYDITFYEEPDYMTRITNGVEEKIYWHVAISYGPLN